MIWLKAGKAGEAQGAGDIRRRKARKKRTGSAGAHTYGYAEWAAVAYQS